MTDGTERRFTPGQVEVRAAAADKHTIGGYAAKFNKASQNLGGFVEFIHPQAFNRAKGNGWPDVMARYNHDDMMLLGTTTARTLRLTIDDVGLVYEVDTPRSFPQVFELVQRGDVNKSSFAFRVIGEQGEEWGLSEQNFPQRTLLSVDLIDVAPVNTPAYLDTSTAVRSLAKKVHASEAEVRKLSEAGDLRKFFMRSDTSGAGVPGVRVTHFGPAVLMDLEARKTDPYVKS
jgi:uncharacterized protein